MFGVFMVVSQRQTLSLNFAFWRGINSECPFRGPFFSHGETHSWLTSGASLRPFSVALVGSLWVTSNTFHCYVYFSNFIQFMGSSFQMNLPKTLTSSCYFRAYRLTMFPKLTLSLSTWNSGSSISRETCSSKHLPITKHATKPAN